MNAYFYNHNEIPIPIENIYKNQSCFLIVSGPSLSTLDLSKLKQPGIITLGVNNSPKVYRPNLWISVDDPANFMISIWRDPAIQKFVMCGKRNKQLWDNNKWCESKYTVMDCPNVTYYNDNEHFKPTDDFLNEFTFNWGNHTNRCECGVMREPDENGKKRNSCIKCGGKTFGSRSVMLAAIKLAYVLGFRKVFIIGADFKMDEGKTYAWDQGRTPYAVKTNNSTYIRLNERFNLLRPIFERRGFYVFNATPNSGLKSFPMIDYNDAIEMATKDFKFIANERTYGMYERKSHDKNIEKNNKKILEFTAELQKINGSDVRKSKRLQRKLERAHINLRAAIEAKESLITWTA